MKKEKPETKICKHCQSEIPYKAKVCPVCKKRVKANKLLWGIIILIILIAGILIFGGEDEYEVSSDAMTMGVEEYEKSCEKVDYKDLARNTDKYIGKKVKFKCQVQQVIDDEEYRVSVTKKDGFWKNDVYLRLYALEKKFIEEDVVMVYGEVSGTKKYTSVLGESIEIPQVEAVYMDLLK